VAQSLKCEVKEISWVTPAPNEIHSQKGRGVVRRVRKQIMTARQEEYREYLKTDYWKKVSLEVKARANFRCQVCNSPNQLNAHHRTYANKGNELEHLDDLTCLCKQCHSLYHGKPVNAAPQGPAVAGDTVWTKPSKKKSKKIRAT